MPARAGESVPKPYYTADMVREMPDDGNRYELVYGELLVSPAPRGRHRFAAGELFGALREFLRAHPVGYPIMSPADISWGRDDVLVQPDVFVVPLEQARTLEWTAVRDLLLVAEVLSPSNQH
ncbi:MAG TPA: Uma2 family endonuclease [Gemmatimonadales bacterium]|nr:Uma2 family endonuclease [Gemmatimonadales bacterium]